MPILVFLNNIYLVNRGDETRILRFFDHLRCDFDIFIEIFGISEKFGTTLKKFCLGRPSVHWEDSYID